MKNEPQEVSVTPEQFVALNALEGRCYFGIAGGFNEERWFVGVWQILGYELSIPGTYKLKVVYKKEKGKSHE